MVQERPDTSANAKPQATVLVVDDRPENLLAMKTVLEPLDIVLIICLASQLGE